MNLQLINLIGASAIAISDSIQNAAEETTRNTASFPAALVIIDRYPTITVDLLGQYLQLSQSGAARLVERLVDQNLVERHQGNDRRFVHLRLTLAGKVMVEEIQQAKVEAVSNLLKPLTTQEQQLLLSLLSKMAGQYSSTEVVEEYICRFCDIDECPLLVCKQKIETWQEKG
ncbi:MarR family transcriptional regulator [Plectonema cf. radiosum LEGE 06105]|uniref:MarR family transcriptional regulator n=1 Tax=Plectonema cf. radiosum LEGE 06105 TaxID=945769 RepID=A0A8J7K3V5_9CYAN|nr:MarR family transcriptional regulator [Plectonema radiosum]MBE9216166.1 MarR family transcriptional regulator [Plectonema cf. radiosum LEGE 06105]